MNVQIQYEYVSNCLRCYLSLIHDLTETVNLDNIERNDEIHHLATELKIVWTNSKL